MKPVAVRHLLALALIAACGQEQPIEITNNLTPSGPRTGARGRITGYLLDPETGVGLTDAVIETFEVDKKVSTKSKEGFFVLDNLTAGQTYRVHYSAVGFATRVLSSTIGQAPTDAYDAIGSVNAGNIPMAKSNGSVRVRLEWASGGVVTDAKVVADFSTGAGYLVTATTTVGADGYFTLENLPALPGGVSQSYCIFAAKADTDEIADYAPPASCPTFITFPGQVTQGTVRLNRYDLNNQDVNIASGIVRDILTRAPIAGVEVFEVGRESLKVTTDASGFFYLPSISVNQQVRLVFKKAPYAEGTWEVVSGRGQSYAGTNMLMFPGGASIDGRAIYQNNLPAKNAEVRLDLRAALGTVGSGTAGFNVFKTVKADNDGKFLIDNLPGWYDGLQNGTLAGTSFSQGISGFNLFVTPWTADPDLFPETQNVNQTVTLYPGAATPVFIQLTSRANVALIGNSAYNSIVGVQDPIKLLFSLPIVPADSTFVLTDVGTGSVIGATVTFADTNRLVTVTPIVTSGSPLWQDGRQYRLTYNVRANNGPAGYVGTNFTFNARSDVSVPTNLGKVATLVVDIADIDSNTRTFNLRWPAVPDAFQYAVYARTNTPRVPEFFRITTVTALAAPTYAVNLGAAPFNTAFDNVNGQSFAFGQKITFLVVPMDSRGFEAAFEKGATVEVGDNVPPRFDFGIAQLDSGGSSPHDVRIRVRGTEALHPTTQPQLNIPPGFTFKAWNIDNDGVAVEGTIVLTGSGSGNLGVQLRDTSGNLSRVVTVPLLSNALIANANFEGGSCNTTGWTVDNTTSCSSCTTQQPSAPTAVTGIPGYLSDFEGSCALSFGQPDVLICGSQTIYTNLDLTASAFTGRILTMNLRSWGYLNAGSSRLVCDLQDMSAPVPATPPVLTTIFSSTNQNGRTWSTSNAADLTPYVGKLLRLRCVFDTQNTCNSRSGYQLDDLRIYVK